MIRRPSQRGMIIVTAMMVLTAGFAILLAGGARVLAEKRVARLESRQLTLRAEAEDIAEQALSARRARAQRINQGRPGGQTLVGQVTPLGPRSVEIDLRLEPWRAQGAILARIRLRATRVGPGPLQIEEYPAP